MCFRGCIQLLLLVTVHPSMEWMSFTDRFETHLQQWPNRDPHGNQVLNPVIISLHVLLSWWKQYIRATVTDTPTISE